MIPPKSEPLQVPTRPENHAMPAERDLEHEKEKQFTAALELEMWKAEQEEHFLKQLKQKEKTALLK